MMSPGEIPHLTGTSAPQRQGSLDEVDTTLRWLANLPAPEGLEGRVLRRVAKAPRGGRVIAWPRRRDSPIWMRNAAAAAIVFVVLGGGFGIYSRVERGAAARGTVAPAQPGGEFSSAGAVRRPETIPGPLIGSSGKSAAAAKAGARAHTHTTAAAARHGKMAAAKPAAGRAAP